MAYSSDAPWRLTRYAQRMLGLKEDGIWGDVTQAAYTMADANLRGRIDAALFGEGLSAYSVARVTTRVAEQVPGKFTLQPKRIVDSTLARKVVSMPDQTPKGEEGWLTLAQLQPMIVAATTGLQHATYDRMIKKLNLEAARRVRNGVTEYNSRSRSGSYRGLFQMGQAAWTDVQGKLGYTYDKVYDPVINARAAALYVENNVRVARSLGYTGPITDAVIYTMHNQGVGGFLKLVRGGEVKGKQSTAAMRVIAEAKSDAKAA